jgi:hypothetical protein
MDWLAIPVAVMTGMAVLIWVAILVEHGFIEYLNKRSQYGWRRAMGHPQIALSTEESFEGEVELSMQDEEQDEDAFAASSEVAFDDSLNAEKS